MAAVGVAGVSRGDMGSRAAMAAPRPVIDGTLPLWLDARTLLPRAPARTLNIVAPGILYISEAYINLIVGDINDQFRQHKIVFPICTKSVSLKATADA